MRKKTIQEEVEELRQAIADFKYEVATLLLSSPRVILFWIAAWVIIRIAVEWLRPS